MLSLYEILKASKTGIAPDMWTALAGMNWGGKDSGAEVKELTGIPPLSFTADGTPLLDYLISGNMSQTGTPTPTTPIQPQGTGERTENLFDAATVYGSMYDDGVVSGTTYDLYMRVNSFNESQIGKQITISVRADKVTATRIFIAVNVSGTGYYSNSIYEGNTGVMQVTVTPQSTSDEWRISYGSYAYNECIISNIMLNTGKTALPYEPYGYKLDISSGDTTTPVYLGEVETTRRIKKTEVEIERVVTLSNGNKGGVTKTFSEGSAKSGLGLCDKALYGGSSIVGGFYVNRDNAVFVGPPTDTLDDFKSKYDGASVWYILATPTTGIVNEPLRKIGDYADTLSMEQAGVQIPTVKGNTVIDVETELKPSEMYIKYQE